MVMNNQWCFLYTKLRKSKITRGHNYTLEKKQSILDVRKYSTDGVHASTGSMFKKRQVSR